MTDIEKVKHWVKEYVRLKNKEAKDIENTYGKGWISQAKFDSAKEAQDWLDSNVTEFDNPIKTAVHSTPDNFKISDVFPNGCYTEEEFSDGTIRRSCIIKPEDKQQI